MSKLETFGYFIYWLFIIRIVIWWILWPLCKYFYIHYYQTDRSVFRPSPRNWAIITGGTDGIGLSYCKHLAKMGYPLMIISRNPVKLSSIRKELLEKFPQVPEIRTVAFDFSEPFDSIEYNRLEEEIGQLPNVHILVNNVGMSFDTSEYFTDISRQDPLILTKLINVNIVSVLRMTLFCLDHMARRHRGIFINISSFTALSPMPLLSVYSATKAFVDYFTRCLHLEVEDQYPDKDLVIQSILPGFVSTKMSKMPPSRFVPASDDYVEDALKTVGHVDRTCSFWWHCIHAKVNETINNLFGLDFYSRIAYKQLLKVRNSYYNRKQRRQQKDN